MIFEFRIWGLFLLFILLTFYSLSKNNNLKKSNYFYILFGSYFLEFIYIIAFITNGNSIMTRIYSFVVIVVLSLYMYYFICLSLRGKYKLKDSLPNEKPTGRNWSDLQSITINDENILNSVSAVLEDGKQIYIYRIDIDISHVDYKDDFGIHIVASTDNISM